MAAAVALTGIWSNDFPPPGSSDTELIEFTDGALISYDPQAHLLTASLPAGSAIDVTADAVRIIGNVAITGDVSVTGTVIADTDVTASGISLKSHTHSGVQAGGANTGQPQ